MLKKKLSIIYHFRVRGTGAEGVHIAGIVNGFRSFGHSVHLISPTGIDPTDQLQQAERKEQNRNPLFAPILHWLADTLPQPLFEILEIFYNLMAFLRLAVAIWRKRPDFIYERYAFFNFSGALLSYFLKIPFIIEVNEISGPIRVRGQYFVALAKFIQKFVFQRAYLVVAVSEFLKHEISRIVVPPTRVITMPNGVPEYWLKNRSFNFSRSELRSKLKLTKKKVVCFVGGLVPWHNFPLLLDVVKSVQKKIPEICLLIVGEGPEKEQIESMAELLYLERGSIILTGRIPHREVPEYIGLSDVAIIPETNSFRSPIKMFEYMAMARPVVAPRLPAIQAVIKDGYNGKLFELGDKISCADALFQVLANKEYATSLGKAAFKTIVKEHTWEMNAKKILDALASKMYKKIAKPRGRLLP